MSGYWATGSSERPVPPGRAAAVSQALGVQPRLGPTLLEAQGHGRASAGWSAAGLPGVGLLGDRVVGWLDDRVERVAGSSGR